jgi:hypothetical protein
MEEFQWDDTHEHTDNFASFRLSLFRRKFPGKFTERYHGYFSGKFRPTTTLEFSRNFLKKYRGTRFHGIYFRKRGVSEYVTASWRERTLPLGKFYESFLQVSCSLSIFVSLIFISAIKQSKEKVTAYEQL